MLKKPFTIDEQINKLIIHGVIIDNLDFAKKVLDEISYYRFTGYMLEFRKSESDSDLRQKVLFEQIYNIYKFDEELKNYLYKILISIEKRYRTAIAYHVAISHCLNEPYDQHYSEENYYNKKGFKKVMETLEREIKYNSRSLIVEHHKTKYDDQMPIWVMVELMSFSNLSKYYNCLYNSDKIKIENSVNVKHPLLSNWLHCLSNLRNYCAHGARIYNIQFSPPIKLGSTFLRNNPNINPASLFAYIYVMFLIMPNSYNRVELANELFVLINKYSNFIKLENIGFPSNYKDFLSK